MRADGGVRRGLAARGRTTIDAGGPVRFTKNPMAEERTTHLLKGPSGRELAAV